ncbi:MAG: exodeoxyribonuclease I [Xanthomonadales bacterium]|nr:exodeoxyribonuclease I [Xanthomonadales bacterium]
MSQTFLWHDYETFGTDPRRDRPAQFAAIRTGPDLRPIGEPKVWFCALTDDYLPDPEACLITGIGPEEVARQGLSECEFAARIYAEMAQPQTCCVGYNSLRFDDEVTRFLLFRNFYDAYSREYRDGNSRWDLIDTVRACYAFRPRGIEWPEHEPGRPSFRLEDIARANALVHERAHDALSDVEATIGLARLIRERQPRLFDFCLGLRDQRRVEALLDVPAMAPLLHVSSRFGAERGCTAMVAPICRHPRFRKGTIVYDLSVDPGPLIELDAEAIHDLVFTARRDLPDDAERIPLKVIHGNRSPVVAPLSILRTVDTARIGLDPDQCDRNLEMLRAADVEDKVRQIFERPFEGHDPIEEEALYHIGFPSDEDRRLADSVRTTPPEGLAQLAEGFRDRRYANLLFRYRARNFPESLDPAEFSAWQDWCRERLSQPDESGANVVERRLDAIQRLREAPDAAPEARRLLDQLERHVRERSARLGLAN